jgi:hypothetical protein
VVRLDDRLWDRLLCGGPVRACDRSLGRGRLLGRRHRLSDDLWLGGRARRPFAGTIWWTFDLLLVGAGAVLMMRWHSGAHGRVHRLGSEGGGT